MKNENKTRNSMKLREEEEKEKKRRRRKEYEYVQQTFGIGLRKGSKTALSSFGSTVLFALKFIPKSI